MVASMLEGYDSTLAPSRRNALATVEVGAGGRGV